MVEVKGLVRLVSSDQSLIIVTAKAPPRCLDVWLIDDSSSSLSTIATVDAWRAAF